MDQAAVFYARRAISFLAERDGITGEKMRSYMREAITEARKTPSPKAEPLWKDVRADKLTPSPEELIVWTARRILKS